MWENVEKVENVEKCGKCGKIWKILECGKIDPAGSLLCMDLKSSDRCRRPGQQGRSHLRPSFRRAPAPWLSFVRQAGAKAEQRSCGALGLCSRQY